MQFLTYDIIKPLIVSAKVKDGLVHCVFKIPNKGKTIASAAPIPQDIPYENTTTSGFMDSVKQSAKYELRKMTYRSARSLFKKGWIGDVGADTNERSVNAGDDYTQSLLRAAVIDAFRQVSDYFHYNETTGRWSSSETDTQFQINAITDKFDKEILTRILVEIAFADRKLDRNEIAFIEKNLGLSEYEIEEWSLEDPISKVEFESVSRPSKVTIYWLAWSIALVDDRLSYEEKDLLYKYGKMMGFSEKGMQQIATKAKSEVLIQYLRLSGGRVGRDELMAFAEMIELSADDAQRALIAYKRR